MATYKYSEFTIKSCIQRMQNLASKTLGGVDLSDTQNVGDMANQAIVIDTKLMELYKALLSLITATANVTQATLDSLLANDEALNEVLVVAIDSNTTTATNTSEFTTQSSNSNDDEYEDIPEWSDS